MTRELGETVSRSLAAQLLGVSHTALARWIKAGDVPVIQGRNGRPGVPVAALVNLYEEHARERASGRRRRHTLEPIMEQGRLRAERLQPRDLVDDDEDGDEDRRRTAERRSLAYHRAVAKR